MVNVKRDVLLAVGLICFAVAYWLGADTIRESGIDTGVGSRALPKGLAYALGGLGLVLLLQTIAVRSLLRGRYLVQAAPAAGGLQSGEGKHLRAFGIVVIGAIYLTVLPFTGYTLGLFLMMTAIALYMGRRVSLMLLGIMAGGAVFYWLLFVQVLRVPLPDGVFAAIRMML